ncbi:hypothetical protein BDV96DRAFT_506993 [Lophiotrema nucula]|uniref:F-box domain-containing protein n=1 Tax=Lophiotrema nucula TaxID=690887 RepID=A0A6A5YI03_9PLEO|nr:hypothetical protein BDV96DRAFT_506993 [Lophiotrema nucula]
MAEPSPATTFASLPAELRIQILTYVVAQPSLAGFERIVPPTFPANMSTKLHVDNDYTSSANLAPLLVCKQWHDDFAHLAFRKTHFVVTDMYNTLPQRLDMLSDWKLQNIRKIAFVAGARQFRELVHWPQYPFNNPSLRLDSLTVVLHRSAHWHYPSDFTRDMVNLLRRLENVKVLKFIRNGANVKGFFKTWYNRLIGLLLKEDHFQRYDVAGGPHLEKTWWEWRYRDEDQSFEMRSREAKPVMAEEEYMEFVKPLVGRLMNEMAEEEMSPSSGNRNGHDGW